jgi:hypothetical protein
MVPTQERGVFHSRLVRSTILAARSRSSSCRHRLRPCLPTPEANHARSDVKRFLILHYGFERPTPEIMKAWSEWFESITDVNIDQGGFVSGREISSSGTVDLPWGMESITGYNIIEAEDLDEAERVARENPFVASIRV